MWCNVPEIPLKEKAEGRCENFHVSGKFRRTKFLIAQISPLDRFAGIKPFLTALASFCLAPSL